MAQRGLVMLMTDGSWLTHSSRYLTGGLLDLFAQRSDHTVATGSVVDSRRTPQFTHPVRVYAAWRRPTNQAHPDGQPEFEASNWVRQPQAQSQCEPALGGGKPEAGGGNLLQTRTWVKANSAELRVSAIARRVTMICR